MQPFLFIGLGNPGLQYEMTRHNLGYLCVQAFAQRLGFSFSKDTRFNALIAKGISEEQPVHLLLPLTYMNLSGVAVRSYVDYFKIHLNRLLVVVDDCALAYGQCRLKAMGSAGGHNGLKSIETYLGTTQYMRLRMGIGHPGERELASYVLDAFSLKEKQELPGFIDSGVKILQHLLRESPSHVMNAANATPLQIKQTKQPQEPID